MALGAVLATAGCATAPAQVTGTPPEHANRYDGGVDQLLLYCGKLHDNGELATAASICERAHTIAPEDPRPLMKLGEILAAMERLPQAVTAYQMILEQTPHHTEARYHLGKSYIAMGRHELALPELRFVLSQNPNDARAYNALGIANGMLGNQDAAREAFETGLKVAPTDIPLRNNLGLALVMSGRHAEGIALLQAVAADPAANATTIRNLRLAENIAQGGANNPAVAGGAPRQPADAPQMASAATDMADTNASEPVSGMPQGSTTTASTEPVQQVARLDPIPMPTAPITLTDALQPLSDSTQIAELGPEHYIVSDEANAPLDITAANPPADSAGAMSTATVVEPSLGNMNLAEAPRVSDDAALDSLFISSMPEPSLGATSEEPADETPTVTGTLQNPMTGDAQTSPSPSPMMTEPQVALLPGEDAYSVQLASYRDADRAEDGWLLIRQKALDLLEDVEPVIRRSDLGADRGVYYRLRTQPSSKSAANQLCSALQLRGISCLTIKENPAAVEDGGKPTARKS